MYIISKLCQHRSVLYVYRYRTAVNMKQALFEESDFSCDNKESFFFFLGYDGGSSCPSCSMHTAPLIPTSSHRTLAPRGLFTPHARTVRGKICRIWSNNFAEVMTLIYAISFAIRDLQLVFAFLWETEEEREKKIMLRAAMTCKTLKLSSLFLVPFSVVFFSNFFPVRLVLPCYRNEKICRVYTHTHTHTHIYIYIYIYIIWKRKLYGKDEFVAIIIITTTKINNK